MKNHLRNTAVTCKEERGEGVSFGGRASRFLFFVRFRGRRSESTLDPVTVRLDHRGIYAPLTIER